MQLQHWVDLSKRKWMMKFLVEQNLFTESYRWVFQTVTNQKVPGSNLGPETGDPEGKFSCFFLGNPERWHRSACNCITAFRSTPSATGYTQTPHHNALSHIFCNWLYPNTPTQRSIPHLLQLTIPKHPITTPYATYSATGYTLIPQHNALSHTFCNWLYPNTPTQRPIPHILQLAIP